MQTQKSKVAAAPAKKVRVLVAGNKKRVSFQQRATAPVRAEADVSCWCNFEF